MRRPRFYGRCRLRALCPGFRRVAPAPGFLETLRELCTKHRVPLVFDEVKTGSDHHVGGYQVVCGVTPDITAFSKALATASPSVASPAVAS